MSRTLRAVIGVICIMVMTFCAVAICQNMGRAWKLDITEQKIYTLSDGTKAILGKLHQPLDVILYYAETATLKAPDQIRYFNNYYRFVRALLEEYAAEAKGMIKFQVIDPRPFSDEEVQALQYGLRRFPITEEESFFFGLVVRTKFGVEKVIPFFSPDRQNFVEYDVSQLIDTAITRQKTKIGIMSSLPVMGDDMSPYMMRMMQMQGQQPKPPWTFVEQLRQRYEVESVATDVNAIPDVDVLLVIHPKDLSDEALFAIDQFVLKGGRTIVCVDPHSVMDRPERTPTAMRRSASQGSDLNRLLRTWGLEMPENTFAGDKTLAVSAAIARSQRAEKIIGYLEMSPEGGCFNKDNVITAELNRVTMLFPGVLREVLSTEEKEEPEQIERAPLIMTTEKGNSWSVSSSWELMMLDPPRLMQRFVEGSKPVAMGYLVTGRLKSSFPEGIEIEVEADEKESSDKTEDPNDTKKKVKKRIKGLTEAREDCVVAVFADVDFISDALAYRDTFFGKLVIGDNSALMLNTIDDLRGSSDLVSIRSRGNFRRPFTRVDEIERRAEAETAAEESKINAEIAGFENELNSILASAKEGEQEVIGGSIVQKKKELELKIHQARRRLRKVKLNQHQDIERLGRRVQRANTLIAPAVILIVAILLGIYRSVKKRHYISHASDA